jgi:hypothetical protein
MFWTCRATVCWLITSSPAISRLLFPLASRRRTSSSRELRPCGGASAPVSVDRRDASRRAKLLERLPGRLKLQQERVVVADLPARAADQEARARGLVGRLELLPGLEGAA